MNESQIVVCCHFLFAEGNSVLLASLLLKCTMEAVTYPNIMQIG